MIARAFRQNVLQLEIITGAFADNIHFIPRVSLDIANDSTLPFNFVRHEFPIRLSFAMTINISQGQAFDKVGLYLPQPLNILKMPTMTVLILSFNEQTDFSHL